MMMSGSFDCRAAYIGAMPEWFKRPFNGKKKGGRGETATLCPR
jgi:hypothetical protein